MTEMNPLFQGTLVPCLVMEKVRQTDGYRTELHSGIDIWRQNKQGFRQDALIWHLGVWMSGQGRGQLCSDQGQLPRNVDS